MAVNRCWDINAYHNKFEPKDHWELKQEFLLAHKEIIPEDKLVSLAQVYVNMELLGCRYPASVSNQVRELSKGLGANYRDSRQNKLQRTFVKASDAVLAKLRREDPVTSKRRRVLTIDEEDTNDKVTKWAITEVDSVTEGASSSVQSGELDQQATTSRVARQAVVLKKPLHVTYSLKKPSPVKVTGNQICEGNRGRAPEYLHSRNNVAILGDDGTIESSGSGSPENHDEEVRDGEQLNASLPGTAITNGRLPNRGRRRVNATDNRPEHMRKQEGRRLCMNLSASLLWPVDEPPSEVLGEDDADVSSEQKHPKGMGGELITPLLEQETVRGKSHDGGKKRVHVTNSCPEQQLSPKKRKKDECMLSCNQSEYTNALDALSTEDHKEDCTGDLIQACKQLREGPVPKQVKGLSIKEKPRKRHVTDDRDLLKGLCLNGAVVSPSMSKVNGIINVWNGQDPLAKLVLVNRNYVNDMSARSILDSAFRACQVKYIVERNLKDKTFVAFVNGAPLESVPLSLDSKIAKQRLALAVLENLCQRCCMLDMKKPHLDDSKPLQTDDIQLMETGSSKSSKPIDSENIGHKMLRMLGWTGGGLGKDRGGRADPIEPQMVCGRLGFGFIPPNAGGDEDSSSQRDFFESGATGQEKLEATNMSDQGAVTPQFKKKVAILIKDFKRDVEAGVHETRELCFSPKFSKEQRKFIHETVDFHRSLKSVSFGKAAGRYIVVSQKLSMQQKLLLALKQASFNDTFAVFMPGTYDSSTFNISRDKHSG